MYHIELRQFPHNFCRFNLTESELRERILDAWVQGEWIELGERKWSPHQANLIVLEGPQLPVEQLSMGRGWRSASRQGNDVTEQLLTAARKAANDALGAHPNAAVAAGHADRPPSEEARAASKGVAGDDSAFDLGLAADSLGLEVLAQLGTEPAPLAIVWRLARERYPKRSASDCLKLAEHAIHSLSEAQLVEVLVENETGERGPAASAEQLQRALYAIDSWTSSESTAASLRRT
jgi:hypothetical protein